MSVCLVFVTVYMRSFTKKRGALTRTKSRGLTQQLNRTISSGLGLKTSHAATRAAAADVGDGDNGTVATFAGGNGEAQSQQPVVVENGTHEAADTVREDATKTE